MPHWCTHGEDVKTRPPETKEEVAPTLILVELFISFAMISMLTLLVAAMRLSRFWSESPSMDLQWVTPPVFAAAVGFAYIAPKSPI